MVHGLNSFRFFAFFIVFTYHMGLFEFGYMGVHAFFVLSGFLLTPIIVNMKEHLPTKQYFINFYGRRSLRIFPLYFTYLFVIGIIAYVALEHFDYDVEDRFARTLEQLGWALTYTYNFFAMSSAYEQTQTITHFWSLAVEEQFYLLWPLLIFAIHKTSVKRTLIILIIAGPIIRFVLGSIVMADTNNSFNTLNLAVYTFTLSSFDAFAIGGFFAMYVKPTANFKIIILAGIVVVIGFVTEYLSGVKFDPRSLGYGKFMEDSYKYIWGYSLFSFVFAAMLVNIKAKRFFPLVMENKLLAYLGKISYGLYVYHFPLTWFVGHELGDMSAYVKAVIILVITTILAAISYKYLEEPLLMKKDKYFPH